MEETKGRLHSAVVVREEDDAEWDSWNQTDLEKRRQQLCRELGMAMEASKKKKKPIPSSSSSSRSSSSGSASTSSSGSNSSSSSSPRYTYIFFLYCFYKIKITFLNFLGERKERKISNPKGIQALHLVLIEDLGEKNPNLIQNVTNPISQKPHRKKIQVNQQKNWIHQLRKKLLVRLYLTKSHYHPSKKLVLLQSTRIYQKVTYYPKEPIQSLPKKIKIVVYLPTQKKKHEIEKDEKETVRETGREEEANPRKIKHVQDLHYEDTVLILEIQEGKPAEVRLLNEEGKMTNIVTSDLHLVTIKEKITKIDH